MADWQPIDTAPKNGTPILAWDGEVIAIIDWLSGFNEWSVSHDAEGYAWQGYTPTHWLPLPKPPQ